MKILEYDQVDPLGVFQLNMLALEFALTPEHAALIRRSDPRPFPYFGIYAVENDTVIGQVGIFRLPMISKEGRSDAGGVWAVSTHPEYSGSGVATILLDEAHERMRKAGLRVAMLGTNRYRVAYKLYRRHGYEDTQVLATALGRWETAHQPTRLRARPLGKEGFDFIDQIFADVAGSYLGFAWRHSPSILHIKVDPGDAWVLWENDKPVGYALAHVNKSTLNISSVLLRYGMDISEAVAAIVSEIKTPYVKVKITRPVEVESLRRVGFLLAQPTWGAIMLKTLDPQLSYQAARDLYGIGTDRFLMSYLDVG